MERAGRLEEEGARADAGGRRRVLASLSRLSSLYLMSLSVNSGTKSW